MSDIVPSVITSLFVDEESNKPPLQRSLGLIAESVARGIELYCFFEDDLEPAGLDQPAAPPPGSIAARIRVVDPALIRVNLEKRLKTWRRSKYLRRIRAIATNLPGVSSLRSDRCENAVEALKKVILVAKELSVQVIEIVAGPNFVRDEVEPRDSSVFVTTGKQAIEARRKALVDSLFELNQFIGRLTGPRPALALEMEPGLSYLLNSLGEVERVFTDLLKKLAGGHCYVQLNLDIGHAVLLSEGNPDLYRTLRLDKWLSTEC